MSTAFSRSFEGAVVGVPVTVPYERYSTESAQWWIGRALRKIVQSSGISPGDIDGFSVSSFTLAPDSAIGLAQHFGLCLRWIETVPLGGVSAIAALRRAARAVQAGDANVVACIGGDTNSIDTFRTTMENFSRFSQDAVYPYGAGGANASFAMIARNYMTKFGVTREDLAPIAVSQRTNALRNPNALFKTSMTIEQYMSARVISDPIHLLDCVMPCAGAEGFLVMSEEFAEKKRINPIRILSTIERHNAFRGDPVQIRGGWAMDVDELYRTAQLDPSDLDVVMTYDDYPVISMMQFEDLGFCAKGEGAQFVRDHDLTIDGDFPHNPSGGQLSCGQPGAAGGFLGLTEAMRQVLGDAKSTQVSGAKTALVSGFGMINYDRGLSSAAAILSEID